MKLKEAALAAWKEQQIENAKAEELAAEKVKEDHARETANTKKAFLKKFGVEPENADGYMVYVDSIQIYYSSGGYDYGWQERWCAFKNCENAVDDFEHHKVGEKYLNNLSDLGQFITQTGQRTLCWYCSGSPAESTETPAEFSAEEKLVAALKELIHENVYSVQY